MNRLVHKCKVVQREKFSNLPELMAALGAIIDGCKGLDLDPTYVDGFAAPENALALDEVLLIQERLSDGLFVYTIEFA